MCDDDGFTEKRIEELYERTNLLLSAIEQMAVINGVTRSAVSKIMIKLEMEPDPNQTEIFH